MEKILIFIVFLVTIHQKINAQNVDSTQTAQKNTPSVQKVKTTVEDSFPNPRQAFLWSIIPGGGQIYNRKLAWLKVPIVYGAIGTGAYFIHFTTKDYRRFKTAYSESINKLPFSDATIPKSVDAARLKQLRDARFKQVQEAYVLTTVAYLLAGVEAFTAAHLTHFDVKDDLSLQLKPSVEPVPLQGNAVGLGFKIKF
ncbi:MAG: DUF5683 domain-containing protein [Saprospiraceae bacterium]|nr:DUF5683 domain-containing protein [Saprospiraceae bacterium]